MIAQTDHYVMLSLKHFLQYKTWSDLSAFQNISGSLYEYVDGDSRIGGKSFYGSPYNQWVHDSSISGAVIPTGVSSYNRGDSGMSIDFINGRVLFDEGNDGLSLTAEYSRSEFNFYLTSNSEYRLIAETKYQQSPDFQSANNYSTPYSYTCPAVFIKNFESYNERYCFGGEDWTIWRFKVIVMAQSEYELYGMQKVIRDADQAMFPILAFDPFDILGDLKDETWNYEDKMASSLFPAFVSDSSFKIVEPDVFTDDNSSIFMGIGNVEVSVATTSLRDFWNQDLYIRPDGSLYFRPDGSVYVRPGGGNYERPDANLFIRPDGGYYINANGDYYVRPS